jgi:hypothetical protein
MMKGAKIVLYAACVLIGPRLTLSHGATLPAVRWEGSHGGWKGSLGGKRGERAFLSCMDMSPRRNCHRRPRCKKRIGPRPQAAMRDPAPRDQGAQGERNQWIPSRTSRAPRLPHRQFSRTLSVSPLALMLLLRLRLCQLRAYGVVWWLGWGGGAAY